jgi:hypothetical protein
MASNLIPTEEYDDKSFEVELMYRPSLPYDRTHWRVFNYDEQIIQFITDGDTLKDQVINEDEHLRKVYAESPEGED